MTPVRLEPAALRSRVKHSTTEPLRSLKDCFDSQSDRRSDERCEGAGKTACELLYSQSRIGVVGSQLFRAAGNTETGFSNFISIAFITAWQSFIKEGACQG